MGSWSETSSDGREKVARQPVSNYRVRFRHGVYPHAEVEATRADIKKYDYFFSSEQKWVGTPRNFDFVDESAQIAADLEQVDLNGTNESTRRPSRKLSRIKTAERVPRRPSTVGTLTTKRSSQAPNFAIIGTSLLSGQPIVATSSPLYARFQHHRHSSPATSSISSLDGSSSIDWHHDAPTSSWNMPPKEPMRNSWPLSDPIEAHLFRVFVDDFARRWDSYNSHDVFTTQIPQLALANPMLLDAILMKASQTICRTDTSFPAKPYVYHERLVQQLIPYLANHGQILDEATLVAAILLRGFEEFHAGTRGQYHLSTYELFHGPDGWLFDMSRPIVQACFMTHVHFEIYQAMLGRPSLQVDYREDVLTDLIMPIDDVAWANRIVWISARILQWSLTDTNLPGDWQHLKDSVDEWERMRPSSFNAFFYREPDMTTGTRFPEVWFPNMCHANAHQHLCVCRMILEQTKPDVLGGDIIALSDMEQLEVTRLLKETIGVARCNPHAGTTPLFATTAAHKFARNISDSRDQTAIMEFLEEVENLSGWPTDVTRDQLRMDWVWMSHLSAENNNNDFL